MISGTPYSPSKAFIEFARHFFEALAKEDYQAALGKLDAGEKRWSKGTLSAHLKETLGTTNICSASDFKQSASPVVSETDCGYILIHRLPLDGKWANEKAVFEFTRKPGTEYFKVYFRGIKP